MRQAAPGEVTGWSGAAEAAREEAKREALRYSHIGGKILVLDDDPTGVQTVHDVPVYTDWGEETIRGIAEGSDPVSFILTNSRGMQAEETAQVHRGIAKCTAEVFGDRPFQLVSRSDSTLRGHFPLETDCLEAGLAEGLGTARYADGILLIPFFEAGGRFTVDDVHYVRQGEALVPAAETEFAKDETFGYRHSNLKDYVEEKTGGRIRRDEVSSVGLALLREGNIDAVTAILMEAEGGRPIVVNALDHRDVEVFCAGLYRAIGQGKRFLYRTAADFVKAFGGISSRPLLTGGELLADRKGPGVVVVGSHTKKTTAQLERALQREGTKAIPFRAAGILSGSLGGETERVRALVDKALGEGLTPVVYTEREVFRVPDDTKEAALARSVAISEALCGVVTGLAHIPAYCVAKGGITSSDLGVKALGVKKAVVAGQIQPGIPVWRTGAESRYPGLPYIIFPGNVGEEETLYTIMGILEEGKKC